VSNWDYIDGHFRILNWRYLPYIRPTIFRPIFQGISPEIIWPNIWYVYVPPLKWILKISPLIKKLVYELGYGVTVCILMEKKISGHGKSPF